MHEAHQVPLIEQLPPRRARPKAQMLRLRRRGRAERVPVRVRADRRKLVERRGEDTRDVKVGRDADRRGRFGQAVVEVQPVDLAVDAQRALGAGDDGFGAAGVPLGESLWPVGFDGLDEPGAQGFAFVFDGELESSVYEYGGVGVKSLVGGATVV